MDSVTSLPLRLVVLISGNGSNLQAIIDACANQTINAEIQAVISNRPEVYGLQRAKEAGIPTEVVDHRQYNNDRRCFEQALETVIDRYSPGLIVLAGFMRILTPEFVNRYLGKMINIHPSLLPNFQGLHTHQRALEKRAEEHGASVHFVTPELDGGPVIIRAAVPIFPDDDVERLTARVLEREHQIFPEAIRWFAEGRLCLKDNQALLDNKPITQLTRQFE